jgi:hypothetical protein
MDEGTEPRDNWRPLLEEVVPHKDEIERMLREQAAQLMDPETKLIRSVDLVALGEARIQLC